MPSVPSTSSIIAATFVRSNGTTLIVHVKKRGADLDVFLQPMPLHQRLFQEANGKGGG